MNHLLKISEFALLSGIKRKNLIYYDQIGLLTPEYVTDNGYRYYSHRQVDTVSVIGALQEVGMPLCEIKDHLDKRTPASLIELFSTQRKEIEEKIYRLRRIKAMIDTRLSITRRALEIDISKINLENYPEELLFAGDEIVCQGTVEERENAVNQFYDLCDRKNIPYGYPFGTMVSQKNLLQGNCNSPSRYFFKTPAIEGIDPMLSKPAGLYLTGFERSSYNGHHNVYNHMFEYMKKNKLAVSGNSYEEFLLDEISIKDPENYILQISIQVKRI